MNIKDTKKNIKSIKTIKNITHKKSSQLSGKIIDKNREGWIILEIRGAPYQRGFAHGKLLNRELQEVKRCLPFLVKTQLKVNYTKYIKDCKHIITPIIREKYPEFYEEICGISKGGNISINEVIGWNSFLSMYSYYTDNNPYRCSAYIATGNATDDSKIVMAHNSHCNFIEGNLQNIILYVYPEKGNSFVMQTAPGYIASGTDWFICSTGIIGCETTISQTNYKVHFGTPYFCRIREAMQYGTTLDSYINIMLKNNAGDYACSWLFGDINTNEIMLFEIGLNKHAIQRTNNGVYYGMNSAIDNNLREIETKDKTLYDVKESSGSRNYRLNYLLNDKFHGKLNVSTSKEIISDHYDLFQNKIDPNMRSICKHSENKIDSIDIGKKSPTLFGATDGKIVTSDMARDMKFEARFGSSCGREFNISEFIRKNPQFKKWRPYVKDFQSHNWVIISGSS